jgi:saccharopine dehydrogenase-like NADP-dependent oxidoreductase
MKHILVLGAGKSTSYLVSHLLREAQEHDWFVTVCDKDPAVAQARINGHTRGQAIGLDINDTSARTAMIGKANIVVNMLTRPYQYLIAVDCLNNNAHMLSASYEDIKVKTLETDAHRRNILILNEMGLDPGIDHMTGMAILEKIRAAGGFVTSFRSYGGGLPAPEVAAGPLQYSITWNPRNVLMAGEDGAIFKEDGKIKVLPFHQVFQRSWIVEVEGVGTMEAYPNRDSLAYEHILGLKQNHTIVRGTLRYPGWSETWQHIVHLGLANESLRIPKLHDISFRELTEMFVPAIEGKMRLEQQMASYLGISPTGHIMQNLKWLGLFSKDKIGLEVETAADVMIHLMQEKLRLPDGARDMVVLVHEVEALYPKEKNRVEKITDTMIEYGTPRGETAISRTVGLPLAITTRLILEGEIPLTGCHIPTHPAIYKPVLVELEKAGLRSHLTIDRPAE